MLFNFSELSNNLSELPAVLFAFTLSITLLPRGLNLVNKIHSETLLSKSVYMQSTFIEVAESYIVVVNIVMPSVL